VSQTDAFAGSRGLVSVVRALVVLDLVVLVSLVVLVVPADG
jgi:hypothetical protein